MLIAYTLGFVKYTLISTVCSPNDSSTNPIFDTGPSPLDQRNQFLNIGAVWCGQRLLMTEVLTPRLELHQRTAKLLTFISNGIALSGTAHWMFDRGLVGLGDDLTILVSRQTNDPDAVRSMINRTEKLIAPDRLSERPRTEFVVWHRENCFKQ